MDELYVIKDSRSGFTCPVCIGNVVLAKNSFVSFIRELPEVPSGTLNAFDFQLFYLGTFNHVTGEISAVSPQFIMSGDSVFMKAGEADEG